MRVFSIKYHRLLALFGGIALLLWGGSGLLHPIMTNFGPQPAVFYPPSQPVDLTGIHPIHDTLQDAGITEASAVKVVATEGRNILQVTTRPTEPRRYFELESGDEVPGYDVAHAEFLARHYAQASEPIRSTEWVTDFTEEYPWVNRLLPVYKVTFDRPDNLSIYVYTETNASAGMGNNFKDALQAGFRWIHTWSWFPREADWARVVLMALLVGSLFALGVTGVGMLLFIKRKVRAPGSRGWHRLAGYVLALPILGYSASGLFHLLTYAAVPPVASLQLSEPINVAGAVFPIGEQWQELSEGLDVSGVSIIEDRNGRVLYRLGLAMPRGNGPQTASEIRNARFEGVERTGPAVYLDAATGDVVAEGDRELALQLGETFTGADRGAIEAASLVTRFGPDYDFRNKRLPVWRLDYGSPVNATIFVDTTTGVLVDEVPDASKAERLSFSVIHKLGFLRALGRKGPDLAAVILISLSLIFLAVLGLQMDLKRRARKRRSRR